MNRNWLLASITGGAVLTVAAYAYFAAPPKSQGDPPKPADPPVAHVAAAPSETSVQLPIGQVVLFSSGVGYFQREGTVDGDARVDLSFPVRRRQRPDQVAWSCATRTAAASPPSPSTAARPPNAR